MQFSLTTSFKILVFASLLLLSGKITYGQTNSVSPFTVFGLGDLSEGYFAQNFGIGGNSIALRSPLFINIANPASYTSIEYTTLETAISNKFIKQTVNGTNQSLNNQSTYFNYFGFGFKGTDWWGMSVSLSPYSFVGYNIFTTDSVADFGDLLYEFQGKGGVNQVVIGNGFEPFKNLSVGINVRYLFGSYDKSDAVLFNNGKFYNAKRLSTVGVSSFAFDYGVQYLYPLSEKFDFIVGGTMANQINLNAIESSLIYNYTYNNSGIEVPVDTVWADLDKPGKITLPSKYGIGASIGKKHQESEHYGWLLSGEFNATKWSKYSDINGESDGLTDSWRASVGGYFTPYYAFNRNRRSKSYLAKVEYRLGGFYENTQVTIENSTVINYGFTAGFGLPFFLRNPAPGERKATFLNLGIVVGNKGNGQLNQINEQYVNLIFGITLGDQWFQKFKYR